MSDIPSARNFLQIESARFRSAVSENLLQTMGGLANFLGKKTYQEKQYFINGPYSISPAPDFYVDGVCIFEFDSEIIDIWVFQSVPGTGGITEIDLKMATTSGGAFTSIFSTTPKLDSTSGSGVWMDSAGIVPPGTGMQQPILATTSIPAGAAIRIDLLQKMTGVPATSQLSVLLQHRPV